MFSHLLLLSGLLRFNGPHRDRALLANGQENEDYDDDDEYNNNDEAEEKPCEERAVSVHHSSSEEEHFMENLPPTLHKGNILKKNT